MVSLADAPEAPVLGFEAFQKNPARLTNLTSCTKLGCYFSAMFRIVCGRGGRGMQLQASWCRCSVVVMARLGLVRLVMTWDLPAGPAPTSKASLFFF
jgi:hypothetical protein